MSANELVEALQAQAWLRLEANGGNNILDVSTIGYRSAQGFQARIITCELVSEYPLLILPLEADQLRTQTAIMMTGVVTTRAGNRLNYPDFSGIDTDYQAQNLPLMQPIHLSWIGPLDAPTWLPFQDSDAIPVDADPDVYNAIALLLTGTDDGEGNIEVNSGDVMITIRKCPPREGVITVDHVIPVPT